MKWHRVTLMVDHLKTETKRYCSWWVRVNGLATSYGAKFDLANHLSQTLHYATFYGASDLAVNF